MGVFNYYFLISLVLTFGVSHQDLVVVENVATRVYVIPEIKFHPVYIKKSKYHVVKEKRNKHWLEFGLKKDNHSNSDC